LRKAKQDFANDFRHLLKSYISVMDNVDVTSAKEIEASLRERLDTESIAVAHEAAESRKMDYDDATREYGGTQGESHSTDENQRVEDSSTHHTSALEQGDAAEETRRAQPAATPVAGESGDEGSVQPEVEEPEVDPSSVENSSQNVSAPHHRGSEEVNQQPAAADASASGARTPEETSRDDEEPTQVGTGQGRTADEFFGQGEERDDVEERKIFRASRFLRRRG
jgi:cell division initiation protein